MPNLLDVCKPQSTSAIWIVSPEHLTKGNQEHSVVLILFPKRIETINTPPKFQQQSDYQSAHKSNDVYRNVVHSSIWPIQSIMYQLYTEFRNVFTNMPKRWRNEMQWTRNLNADFCLKCIELWLKLATFHDWDTKIAITPIAVTGYRCSRQQ